MIKKLTTFISFVVLALAIARNRAEGQEMQTPLTFIVLIDISGSMDDRFPAPVQPVLTDSTKLMDVKRRLSLLVQYLPENTRVLVNLFDHEVKQLVDLRLDSLEARTKLQQAFASIKSRNGSTYLWRAVDAELARANAIVDSNRENRVRVLLYSDGNDMEHAPGLDHNSIISKYGKSLQAAVKLDWIEIAYDVGADAKRALQQSGVNFTKADRPTDIDPLIAGFQLSTNTIQAGEEVVLTDASIGIDITQRVVDWGDKTRNEQGKVLRHSYAGPGTFTVNYFVKTAGGRTNQTTATIKVEARPQPAKIHLAKSQLTVGESLRAEDVTFGIARSRQWKTSGGQESTATVFETSFSKPGAHTITLDRIDSYGQASQAVESVTVKLPQAPIAKFRMATSSVRLGERFSFINESTDSAERFEWSIDGKAFSDQRHPTLAVDSYGEHTVELTASDRWNQSHASTLLFSVARPEQPVAEFTMPETVSPGTELTLVDTSKGTTSGESQWFLDRKLVGSGRVLKLVCAEPGRHSVRLTISGPSGETSTEKLLVVEPFPAPKAGFTVGNETPFVGDVIKITDTSSGPVERMVFEIAGFDTPIIKEMTKDTVAPWFELPCSRAGEVTVTQRVVGLGGQDTHLAVLKIASRSVQPKAEFAIRRINTRGKSELHFDNRSQGSVDHFEFDPGEGSPVQRINVDADITYTYEVGNWIPKIVAHGPEGEGLQPSVWIGQEIEVAKPTPTWILNLLWQLPCGLMLVAALAFIISKVKAYCIRKRQRLIAGHFTVRKPSQPRDVKHFEFDGISYEEVVDLEPHVKLKIKSIDDGLVHYQVELARDGQVARTADLGETGEATVGEYVVSYTA